ncbi:hypothetical protein CP8484711_1619, partial [Chlamydia psittaci 84-8471/1]
IRWRHNNSIGRLVTRRLCHKHVRLFPKSI